MSRKRSKDAEPRPLSKERAKVLRAIRACGSAYGITIREIAVQVNRAPVTVAGHVRALALRGLIRSEDITTGKRGRPARAWFAVGGDGTPEAGGLAE